LDLNGTKEFALKENVWKSLNGLDGASEF